MDITELKELIKLLKEEGVTEFEGLDCKITFASAYDESSFSYPGLEPEEMN